MAETTATPAAAETAAQKRARLAAETRAAAQAPADAAPAETPDTRAADEAPTEAEASVESPSATPASGETWEIELATGELRQESEEPVLPPLVVAPVARAVDTETVEVSGVILKRTTVGALNTCWLTGRQLEGVGYAENDDAARAGRIYHPDAVLLPETN